MRPPLSWEMILLGGCLRAVPAFLAKYRPGDGARSEMTVPVANGELDLVLSWVESWSTGGAVLVRSDRSVKNRHRDANHNGGARARRGSMIDARDGDPPRAPADRRGAESL